MVITGTDRANALKINFGDTVMALGGADTITVSEADPYGSRPLTPYGLIDGGAGIDRLVLQASQFSDWTYTFSDVRSVEQLDFTNGSFYFDRAQFLVTVPGTATGTVAAGNAMTITASAGGNEVAFVVTGGMGGASAITFSELTFVGFDSSEQLATQFSNDYVELRAGDGRNYVLRASDAIGELGIEQDLIGNTGNDTLIGSVGGEYMSGLAGADKLYGKGGNDVLGMGVSVVAEDLFNGGAGTDFLYITSAVTFAGTVVSIEGIRFDFDATLNVTASQMRMLPAALQLSGSVTETLNITEASRFSASQFTFLGDFAPTISITGTAGADVITGSSQADILDGGAGADRLSGRAGADSLYGGDGADIMIGGAGGDAFNFDTLARPRVRDTITDFNAAEGDFLTLEDAVFAAVTQTDGHLSAGQFHAGAGAKTAQDAADRIIYNTTTGVLYYDADGLGGKAAIAIVQLKGQPALTAADILII